jgi:dTDP-3-amino-2,3,6-trideoxy-4-keto-D-glucose/dTDP-3-amino-3,4,6-trideoxy-alpha-D-glucose/dTDP-2,6-dideoxy-D-kanosamine transaminase
LLPTSASSSLSRGGDRLERLYRLVPGVTSTERKTRIPVADPRRGVRAIQGELLTAFERVVASGRYIHGPEHVAFEREFAEFLGVRHCLGVACGTDALELALIAVGCRAGDEVVTAANAGGYAATAAFNARLRPVFADVEPATLCLSRSTVETALTPATRAVVVTHLYGLLGDVESIVLLCRERGIAVVEDCAQAAGARRGGKRAGSFGDAAAFSFYPTKSLGGLGDGGAVATQSDEVATSVDLLREYGWEEKYRMVLHGGRNSRLDELQAAVLRIRLTRLDDSNEMRRRIVRSYAAALRPEVGRLVLCDEDDFDTQLAVVFADDRDSLRATMEAAWVGTDVHYPVADHRQPAWRADYADVRLPVTDEAVDHVLTLPTFPELTDSELERICEALHAA